VSTKQVSLDIESPSGKEIESIVSVLLGGGVIVYPSETVYGIMCRADNQESVKRICRMKGYERFRAYILIVNGTVMAESIADISDPEVREILCLRWPGKLTFILPAKEECPEWVKADDNTVALRHPADSLSMAILGKCGVPLVSTSANPSNEPPVLSVDLIAGTVLQQADLIIDGGVLPESSPSTIIKLVRGRT